MIRQFHRWPGLIGALFLSLVALTGAALSVYPAYLAWSLPQQGGQTVAQLLTQAMAAHPSLTGLMRAPDGRVSASFTKAGRMVTAVIDPTTGAVLPQAAPTGLEGALIDLHRTLFLGDGGRVAVAVLAGVMVLIALTGLWLLARRAGGWQRLLAPFRGAGPSRWHAEMARLAMLGLILSSLTGLWMSASVFDLLPTDTTLRPTFTVSKTTGATPDQITLLAQTPVTALRSLTLPRAGKVADTYRLVTWAGTGYADQGSGATLGFVPVGVWDNLGNTMVMLHTGQGAPVLGLILGLMALAVPGLAISGAWQTMAARAKSGGRPHARADQASTIILVGSEGGTTWRYAHALARALSHAGGRAHVAAMQGFDPARWPRAELLLVLAATYGDGEAPATAHGFLDRLARLPGGALPVAVLGFGDRSFPAFCAYAQQVADAFRAKGWPELLPMATVDRQSADDITAWGADLGRVLGQTLDLEASLAPDRPAQLRLIARQDYGHEVQAPTVILRFALPKGGPMARLWGRITGRGFARFEAGDLLAILPKGQTRPRLYSLASGARDGFLEIAVRRHPGGVCSDQLFALEMGDTVTATLRRNPGFHLKPGAAPAILIGAGTGVAPLAGFIRANGARRPLHLIFGLRDVQSDFLYRDAMTDWHAQGRLATLTTAVSRQSGGRYVQDVVRHDGAAIARLVADGAHVMVCGGRDMARAVRAALADVLAPLGQDLATLKAEGRYAEDVY